MSMPITSDARATAAAISLPIEGMTCASCVGRVEAALAKVPGVDSVSVNLATERADIRLASPVDRIALIQAVEKVGYDVPAGTVELAVEGMTCASCVGRVEKALKAVPGVTEATVNLATERATVRGVAAVADLIAAIEKVGYEANPVDTGAQADEEAAEKKDAERAELKRDLTLAAVLALPVFVLEMGSHMIPGMHEWVASTIGIQQSWYLQFVLTLLVLAIPGWRFYEKGFPALFRLGPDMNSLVAVGTAAAFGYSMVATFAPSLLPAGTVNVYYEAAAVIVALILLGRFLEARAKGRTSEAIKRLLKNLNVDDEKYPPRELCHFINAHKEQGIRAGQAEVYDSYTQKRVEIYAEYETQCNREGVVDFAELLLRCHELLQRFHQVGGQRGFTGAITPDHRNQPRNVVGLRRGCTLNSLCL